MNKVIKLSITIVLFILLTSCASKPHLSSETDTKTIDWKKEGFSIERSIEVQQEIWPYSYEEWTYAGDKLIDGSELVLKSMLGIDEKHIYRMWGKQSDALEDAFIEKYRPDTHEQESYSLKKMIPENCSFVNAKLLRDDRIAILVDKYVESKNMYENEIIISDYEKVIDVISVDELIKKTSNLDMILCDYYVDINNGVIISTAKEGDSPRNIYAFNSLGELLSDFARKDNEIVYSFFKDSEDNVFFPVYDTESSSMDIEWYDPEKKVFTKVATIEDDCPIEILGKYDECILYQSIEGIVKWDICTGKRNCLFPMTYDGYREYVSYDENSEMTIYLYKSVGDTCLGWTVLCTNEPIEKADNTIRIFNLTDSDRYVKEAAILASQRNPQYLFQYEQSASGQLQNTKTRIFADIINGEGPDIIYLSYEDFESLGKNGMLMDIRDVLSVDEISNLLPGALELGTVDGKTIGIPCDISIASGVTLKSIYSKESWGLDDIYSLAETGDYSDMLFQSVGSFAPRGLFNILMEFELSRNHFLNLQEGTCDFDTEEFKKILQKSKEYGHIPINTDVTLGRNGGMCLITSIDLEGVAELLQQYGEDTNFVGYPTDGNSGHIISSEGIIAINSRSEKIPIIKCFLECLLYDEIQYAYNGVAITKITSQKEELYKDFDDAMNTWRGIPIYVTKDGTSSLDVYISLLENSRPANIQKEKIVKEILIEEAAGYFEGQKNESEVAIIVQNRVSLWLEENK